MRIREFRQGDEAALLTVFRSAIHETACRDYRPEQLAAWAPAEVDMVAWEKRLRGIAPFVVECAGQAVAYADLQADGYIDHFFVAGPWAGQGIGHYLMNHLIACADTRALPVLSAHVSLTAQRFFAAHGFVVVEHRTVCLRGIPLSHAHMRRDADNRTAPLASPTTP